MSKPAVDADSTPARPWRRRLLIGLPLLFVLVCLGACVYQIVAADWALRAAIAAADAADPRWRLGDIEADRVVVPDAENSAATVAAAKALLPTKWPNWNWPDRAAKPGAVPDAVEKLAALGDGIQTSDPRLQLNDEQTAALRTELKRATNALAVSRKLADQREGRHPITYSPDWFSIRTPHLRDITDVSRLLIADSLSRAQEGDADGALESCRAALNAARSIGDEPILISQLDRMACRKLVVVQAERVLAQGTPSEEALAQFQQALEREQPTPVLLIGIRGERAGLDGLMAAVDSGVGIVTAREMITWGYDATGKDPPLSEELLPWTPGFMTGQRAAMLRYMNRAVELAALSPEQRHAAFGQWQAGLKSQPILVQRLAPSLTKQSETATWSQAQLRCAIAATAAERFRRANNRWPDGLDSLTAASYLKEVPTDPYDGHPLRWRRLDDGVVVYTVGPHGEDNGGKMVQVHTTEPGTNIGFRLWDAAKRCQSPAP